MYQYNFLKIWGRGEEVLETTQLPTVWRCQNKNIHLHRDANTMGNMENTFAYY